MHLGRFHSVISYLADFYTKAEIPAKLDKASNYLEQYISNREPSSLEAFKAQIQKAFAASTAKGDYLDQPYAMQVIEELSLRDSIGERLKDQIAGTITDRSFDHSALMTDLRKISEGLKKIGLIINIDKAFSELGVEFERLSDGEAEVGLLLPREIVGETLQDLTSEFSELSKLFRAINELTGAPEYDPRIKTISSSWWQVFLDLQPEQILVWVVALERIIGLFKTNLEILNLRQSLSEKDMPEAITKAIEDEVEKRVGAAIEKLAADIRREHAKIDDGGRLNEIEVQLKRGFRHLAKRINQGAKVEINLAVHPIQDDSSENPEGVMQQVGKNQLNTEELVNLRQRALSVSSSTVLIDKSDQLLIDFDAPANASDGKNVIK